MDSSILKLDEVRKTKGVVIERFARMPKYNELYNKFDRNLNKLLAWYHSKSLIQALDERPAPGAARSIYQGETGRRIRKRPQILS